MEAKNYKKKLPPLIDKLAKAIEAKGLKVKFGLEQQGHLELIESKFEKIPAFKYNNTFWLDLGKEIGWDALTACLWYFRFHAESLSKPLHANSVANRVSEGNGTPNYIQISEKMAEECVSKIILSGWVDIKNRHMVELTIRNSMSDYHSFISQLPTEGEGWISVDTRLPPPQEKGSQDWTEPVMGGDSDSITRGYFNLKTKDFIDYDTDEVIVIPITHWQPLPHPPVKEEKEEEPVCTKPDCDCLERAEEKEEGDVKEYPCLMSGAIKKWAIENGDF